MNFYNAYDVFLSLFSQGKIESLRNNAKPFLCSLCFAAVVFFVLFTFQAIGLYAMAKKQNVKGKWRAFVPFVNVYLIGRLTGPCDVFGIKMKRTGLYAMLSQIVAVIFSLCAMLAEFYLFCFEGETMLVDASGYAIWESLGKLGMIAYRYYSISEYLIAVPSLLQSVLFFVLVMGLYKKYSAKNYLMLSWLELFVPLSRYIVIFVLRNKKPIDFDEYMRKKREEYARRMASYGNPYGYGGGAYRGAAYGGNTYGNNPYARENQAPKEPQEPFPEFGGEEPFSEFSENEKKPSAEKSFSDSNDSDNKTSSGMPPKDDDGDGFFD